MFEDISSFQSGVKALENLYAIENFQNRNTHIAFGVGAGEYVEGRAGGI